MSVALSPTTGEPVTTVARRNRLGLWMCIVSDASGTIALLIAYAYLWGLNVNDKWAPPANAWAPDWPFWGILLILVLATVIMWWGAASIRRGHRGRLILASIVSSLLILVAFVGQIIQIATLPFGPSDGAYASTTIWLCLGAAAHLFMVLFLTMAILGRTHAGRITEDNPSHARLVAMWMTWVCVAVFFGALLTTTLKESGNTESPTFGVFQE